MKGFPDFKLDEPRRWLAEGSRTSYYLLDGDIENSIKLAVAAMNTWRVVHAKERTRWNSASANRNRITKMVLTGPFLLQRTLLEKAEVEEQQQEAEWQAGRRDQSLQTIYTRYIKHLILQAIYHVSFHIVVATTQVLRTYDDDQAAAVYFALRQTPINPRRRWKTPYEEIEVFDEWRDKLFFLLLRRFYTSRTFNITRSSDKREPHFVMLHDACNLTEFVRNALELFTPWGVELLIPDGIKPHEPAPEQFRFEGRRLIDELPFEYRRAAVLINPSGFDKIIEGLGYDGADSKLQLPQANGNMRKQDDDRGTLKPFPGLSQEQVIEALEDVARAQHERKELRASSLTVEVDGTPTEPGPVKLRLRLTRGASTFTRLPPDARFIDVYADPKPGGRKVQISYLSLPTTEIDKGRPWRSSIQLEGGQSILLKVNPQVDESGRLVGSVLKISYSEPFSIAALTGWLKESLTLHPTPEIKRRWASAFVFVFVFSLASLAIYRSLGGDLSTVANLFPWKRSVPSPTVLPNDGRGKEEHARQDQQNNQRTAPPRDLLPDQTPEPSSHRASGGASTTGEVELRDGRLIIKGNNRMAGSEYYGIRITYQDVLRESFVLPARPVKPIPSVEQTMSGGEVKTPLVVKSPNGIAVRATAPTLKWETKVGNNFIVSVYSDDVPEARFTPILKNENVSGREWVPTQPLMRGHRYTWQVRQVLTGPDEQSGHVAEGRFRVLTEEELQQVETVEAIMPRSHLVMSHIYAKAGLLEDAKAELVKLQAQNPNSKIAKRLLNIIEKQLNEPDR